MSERNSRFLRHAALITQEKFTALLIAKASAHFRCHEAAHRYDRADAMFLPCDPLFAIAFSVFHSPWLPRAFRARRLIGKATLAGDSGRAGSRWLRNRPNQPATAKPLDRFGT